MVDGLNIVVLYVEFVYVLLCGLFVIDMMVVMWFDGMFVLYLLFV